MRRKIWAAEICADRIEVKETDIIGCCRGREERPGRSKASWGGEWLTWLLRTSRHYSAS